MQHISAILNLYPHRTLADVLSAATWKVWGNGDAASPLTWENVQVSGGLLEGEDWQLDTASTGHHTAASQLSLDQACLQGRDPVELCNRLLLEQETQVE